MAGGSSGPTADAGSTAAGCNGAVGRDGGNTGGAGSSAESRSPTAASAISPIARCQIAARTTLRLLRCQPCGDCRRAPFGPGQVQKSLMVIGRGKRYAIGINGKTRKIGLILARFARHRKSQTVYRRGDKVDRWSTAFSNCGDRLKPELQRIGRQECLPPQERKKAPGKVGSQGGKGHHPFPGAIGRSRVIDRQGRREAGPSFVSRFSSLSAVRHIFQRNSFRGQARDRWNLSGKAPLTRTE